MAGERISDWEHRAEEAEAGRETLKTGKKDKDGKKKCDLHLTGIPTEKRRDRGAT